MLHAWCSRIIATLLVGSLASLASAQSVCLPAPRLLTTMPMGAQVGTEIEVTISGEHLEETDELVFSDPRITAVPKRDAAGQPEANKYVVSVGADCPPGIYEARVMSRLGLSSSRVFSVGLLPEVVQAGSNTSLANAMPLELNSICNAVMTNRAIDHYVVEARQGQRLIVDCATRGIDSKLDAVITVADESGRDLLVERRGGVLDFTAAEDGRYVIKVHELTYKGGPAYFYRLGVWELPDGEPIVRQPRTDSVNAFSWPPTGLSPEAPLAEIGPNSEPGQAQRISLPCDLVGSFYPAADVDYYEFEAKRGEEWWVEVASERLGLPTNPAVLIQHIEGTGEHEIRTDVAEFVEIPSPVKVSSNGYAYDGPPYNAGTSDVLGKVLIQKDGRHRLQITDLFGGTRSHPEHVYRLVIRKAEPDFALVAWALHMELRNGDRNALSKPISLRGGATMALEVIAIRRDGFDGDIELVMEDLPEGVTARGLKIPSGKSRGMMLVTAQEDAPRGWTSARFFGRASVNGEEVTRPCRLASMAWPIPDSWGEIPSPRLLADVPVSVGGYDVAPLTLAPETEVFEVTAGEPLKIPLRHVRRSEFSGASMQLKTMGAGFDGVPAFSIPLTEDRSEAVLNLAAIKPAPGEYTIAFYGGAVARYRHQPEAVFAAEVAHQKAERELRELLESETSQEAAGAAEAFAARKQAAEAAVAAAAARLKQATEAAQPRDIVDIVVSEPITIRVKPAEES